MKIGIDTRALLGRAWFGSGTGSIFAPAGVAGYVFNIIDNLTRHDSENEYILFFNSFKRPDTRLIQDILNKPNVKLRTFRIPNKIFDRSARFLSWPKIDSLLDGVDVFFSPHFNITPLSKKTRHVLTIHDISFEFYPSFFPWRKRFWHWTQNIKAACQRADHIIAVSKNTKQDLINHYGIPQEKISVVYSGININTSQSVSSADISSVKSNYSLPDNYALFLGTLEPRKNIESIVEAFDLLCKQNIKNEEIKSMHLVIAGGKGWLYHKIYKIAQKSNYREKIHFLDYFPENDKPALIAGAKLFLFPSYYEGFGFPPLESATFGTPVITSLNSSLTEILGHSAFLIDPYNVNDIAHAMKEIASSVNLNDKKSSNSAEEEKKYSWSQSVKQTLDILLSADKML